MALQTAIFGATHRHGVNTPPAPPRHAELVRSLVTSAIHPSLPSEKWFSLGVRLSSHSEDEGMPQRRHKSQENLGKLPQADVLESHCQSVAEAVRLTGVTRFTFCRLRKEFGGLKTNHAPMRQAVSRGQGCARRRSCRSHGSQTPCDCRSAPYGADRVRQHSGRARTGLQPSCQPSGQGGQRQTFWVWQLPRKRYVLPSAVCNSAI